MLTKKDRLIILILTIFFGMLASYKLGNHNMNNALWQPNSTTQEIRITFPTPTTVNKIYFQNGLVDGKYHFEYISPSSNQIVSIDTQMDRFRKNFQWSKVGLYESQPISQITLKIDRLNIQLIQLAFYDNQNNYISHVNLRSENGENLSNLVTINEPQNIDNNYMSSTIFDEIYYTASAYQYLNGIPPYVNVHPPLGMLLIGVGILLFGMSPFGWRITCCSSSILLVPVIYIFSKRMFNSTRIATLTTLLIVFELMHFTIGRLAFLDSIVTLFITMEYYYLYRYIEHRHKLKELNKKAYKYLLFCGVFLGLGVSTKLNAGFSAPAILLAVVYYEFIKNRYNLKKSVIMLFNLGLIFIAVPLTIYTLSYIPYANSMHSSDVISFTINKLVEMKHYQVDGLKNATHPYASSWWSWPLLIKPMSIFFWRDPNTDLSSSMVFIGNPAVFWPSILLFVYLITQFIKTHDYKISIILLGIICQYLPFAIITRISFIYYFYTTVPFLILGYGYIMNQFLSSTNKKLHYSVYTFIIINGLIFLMFYPAISGMVVPRTYIVNNLLWIPGWNF